MSLRAVVTRRDRARWGEDAQKQIETCAESAAQASTRVTRYVGCPAVFGTRQPPHSHHRVANPVEAINRGRRYHAGRSGPTRLPLVTLGERRCMRESRRLYFCQMPGSLSRARPRDSLAARARPRGPRLDRAGCKRPWPPRLFWFATPPPAVYRYEGTVWHSGNGVPRSKE
jgi:hypothetical protein